MSLLFDGFSGFGQTGTATIQSVSGSSVTLSAALNLSCGGAKPNKEMRRNLPGLAEYVGTVKGQSGKTYNLSYHAVKKGRTPPRVGDKVYLYCANGGGGGGGVADVISSIGGGESGEGLSPVVLGIIVIGGAFLISRMLS